MIIMQAFFEFSSEVAQAFNDKKPVLALESTVITHGLPYPQNLETGLALEQLAREQGAVPATIAIMNGKIKIGLSKDELERLAQDKQVIKASKRDLAYALTQRLNAGTTVAATLVCAAACGIKVFATGGIGGVHRGDDFDISADLIELSRTPVAVVCAGVKAILDLPRTMELLETLSVPILGYLTDTLPAFYSASTQFQLPARVNDVASLAAVVRTHWQLGNGSGVLVANPIPAEHAIPSDVIEPVIAEMIEKAEKMGIKGKAITPFLLSEVAKATSGKSQQANIALIKNNTLLGAKLAAQLSY